MNAIESRNLTKTYGATKALDSVTLALQPNKIIGLLGRNGAGKTTLLNIVSNKLFATTGDALVDGEPAAENPNAQAKICYMTEKNLYPSSMRVREAFRWAGEFYPGFDLPYAEGLAGRFGLDCRKKIRELSTGYRSIFKLILVLASGAPIQMFDEPVLGLDANHRQLFYRELIARFSEKPATVIVSTHLIEEVAEVLEEVVVIHRGRILLHQSVEDVLKAAYTISGEAGAVEAFAAGRAVIHRESIGRFQSATVREPLDEATTTRAREANLDVSAPTLQKLFIELTNE